MGYLSSISDEKLQAMAADGDRQAEEMLAERYQRLVRICARPFFLAGGDSEDLTQEGMMGLLSAIREYDSSMNTAFKTYAELCIHNRIITAVRSAARMKHLPLNEGVSLDQILSDETQSHPAYTYKTFRRIPEEQVLARESKNELFHTYSRCLSRFESKILEFYLQGFSYNEIAQKVGKPAKSVDNAVQRIRRKLEKQPYPGEISEG